jgi:hypothetical protein
MELCIGDAANFNVCNSSLCLYFGLQSVFTNSRNIEIYDKVTFVYSKYLLNFETAQHSLWGHAVVQLVEALRYKSEGRVFDSKLCHWNFLLT